MEAPGALAHLDYRKYLRACLCGGGRPRGRQVTPLLLLHYCYPIIISKRKKKIRINNLYSIFTFICFAVSLQSSFIYYNRFSKFVSFVLIMWLPRLKCLHFQMPNNKMFAIIKDIC